MHIPILTIAVLLLLSLPAPASAESTPRPARKTQTLEKLESDLAAKKAEEARLAGQVGDAEKELQSTRKSLKETAARARESEQALVTLEGRIAMLSAERETLTARLQRDYGSMADLILALERLRRVPPEALLVRPGAPLETAQTALLLQSILPAIDRRADRLGADLKRLQDIGESLALDRRRALEEKAALDARYAEVKTLAAKREKLYRTLNSDYRETAAAVARIGQEARSMQELMTRLAEENRRNLAAAPETPRTGKAEKTRTRRSAAGIPRPGRPRLPVAGTILTAFGEKDLIGAVSQGVTIESPSSGLALAPIGGIVRYAGHFKNYGQMVILEHKDGYHSLIAGLDHIDIAVGQGVEAGEPLGKLPSSSSRGGKPALYYELRHKGRPINPSDKFSDLRS